MKKGTCLKKWNDLSPPGKYIRHKRNPKRYPMTEEEMEDYRKWYRNYFQKRNSELRQKAIQILQSLGNGCAISNCRFENKKKQIDRFHIHHVNMDKDKEMCPPTRHQAIIDGSYKEKKEIILLCPTHHKRLHRITDQIRELLSEGLDRYYIEKAIELGYKT